MNTHPRNAGFTLVELMVVIGLIGLLLVFAIPTFQAATRGGNLRTAVFQLNSALSLGRQTAITSRQVVHVLFPDDAAPLYSGDNRAHVEKAFRAFALHGSRDGYMGEWHMLPPSVVFEPDLGTQADPYPRNMFNLEHSPGNFIYMTSLADGVRFPDNDGDVVEMFALVFRADGTMSGGSVQPTVYLAEGWTEYDVETGTLNNLAVHDHLPLRGITFNAITGQSMIREFDAPNP